MLTYEDFLACGEDEKKKINFIQTAISEHKHSQAYLKAVEAQLYYDGVNPTINNFEKIIFDMKGKAHIDLWTANHKIASQFFPMTINQEVAYMLGNGVIFGKKDTKKKLGKLFDAKTMKVVLSGRIAGQSFGYWNYDHMEAFRLTEFVPIKGEENGALMLGVRWWQIAVNKPLRVTLYELDGVTEYIQRPGEEMKILEQKKAYMNTYRRSEAEGVMIVDGQNYDGFPIVPFYANDKHESAITGKRNTIDALDLATSNMVNNVDEGNLIYWVLTNCGGMDDLDDAQFLEQLRITHVTHADGDSGAKAEAHTVEAPFEGTEATIKQLENRLYKDFQAFDPDSISQSNQSATAIRAAYIPLDLKCDIVLEPQVTEFICGILKLAGIDDDPSYQRNQILNKMEETQTLVIQAPYFDDDYITKKMLFVNGDIDMYDELQKRKDAEGLNRTKGNKPKDEQDEEAEDETDKTEAE